MLFMMAEKSAFIMQPIARPNHSQTCVYILETFQVDSGEETARASSADC